MKKIISITAAIFISLGLQAHPWKPSHYVIIDTDGGIDDMRAICMMLASPDVRVLAITTSAGALSAENAFIKVKSLLNSLYHEGIPIGINRNKINIKGQFSTALEYKWGDERGIDAGNTTGFIDVISDILANEKSKVSFICMGGVNTAAESLKNIPEFRKQVKEIVWSCNGLKDTSGFNFNIDRISSEKIINEGIPVNTVLYNADITFYDKEFQTEIRNITSPYAKKINEFFQSAIGEGHKYSFVISDELVPLFLHYPELFRHSSYGNNSENIMNNDINALKTGYIKILKGETVARNQIIKELPLDPSFYFDDIQPFASDIIEGYGVDEWYSGVIACELHRHLGVFATIGVKLGIRAREYFNTGVDEFEVVSYAGSATPLSCMNDGLQVSTGATPGHGLLTVKDDSLAPSAEFKYMNHIIRMSLKPELAKKITDELKEINFVYGLDSNIYWELVRKNTIKYWRELDRHEIFIIETIK
ncbi:MAG TPA: nucleoside hydrolase [Bacteroidales bacterium]|nr:nucleoside hydrolase [Bacteroidales bacterium]